MTSGLLVCTHKDCRKATGWTDLVDEAATTRRAHEVPCQDVCKGPVVGYAIDGDVRWFAKVTSAKRRKLISTMVATGHVPDGLRDREARKRRGVVRGQNRMHPLDPERAEQLTSSL